METARNSGQRMRGSAISAARHGKIASSTRRRRRRPTPDQRPDVPTGRNQIEHLGEMHMEEKSKTEPKKAAAQEQSGTWQRKRKGEEQRWCSAVATGSGTATSTSAWWPRRKSFTMDEYAAATRFQFHLGHNGSPLPCRAEAEG